MAPNAIPLIERRGNRAHSDIGGIGAQMQTVPEHLLEAAEYAQTMSAEEIEATIHRIVEEHGDDHNFPPAVVAAANRYLHDEEATQNAAEFRHLYEELKVEAALIVINSPYAEVRALVDNHDDPRVSGATFRTLIIGTMFVGIGAFINQLFSIRYPTVAVSPTLAQVLAFPAAKLMELLPATKFTTFGYTWSLNPGKFNLKEHVLITPQYFNQTWASGFGYQIMVTLSTNLIGYGLAGLTRHFLVYPAHAIWPRNLALISFIRAFHTDKQTVVNGWRLSKMRWFLYCFGIHLAAITGSLNGLGFNPIPTFDWNQISQAVDPLINPFSYIFENTGELWEPSKFVDSNGLLDQTLYENYSPRYLSAAHILIYGVFFAVSTATVTHTILFHRREIAHGFKSILSRKKPEEVHRDVHLIHIIHSILLIAVAIGAAAVRLDPAETLPTTALCGVVLAIVFVIPVGIILASTNVQIPLNVLSELLGGLWFPGNAIAASYFKVYGLTSIRTLAFAQDLKLAYYMHIPPSQTFWAQIYATIVSSFISAGILNYQMTKIPGVCTPEQVNRFSCPAVRHLFIRSVLWGTLGPKRMFGPGGIYNNLLYCFLIGAVLPIPFFLLRKRFKVFEYIHLPVLLTGGTSWAPYNLANIWPAVLIAYVFNVYIKKRYIAWWSKYNYITSAAFTTAIAASAVIIFIAVELPAVEIAWSGNTRPFEGCDAAGCARLPIPDSGFFGPGPGEFY
ncbi:OPT-domain-containing protein [Mycena vulgaris]|nr:OPT-domain-containing protein [Mycena vulgaris]